MLRSRRLIAALIAAIALLTAPACGGDASPDPDPEGEVTGITPDEFAEQANAVCRSEQALQTVPPTPQTADAFISSVRSQIEGAKRLRSKLAELETPIEDREDIEAWLDLIGREIEVLEEGLPAAEEAAEGGDLEATTEAYAPAIQKFAELDAENTFALDYGLTECEEEEPA